MKKLIICFLLFGIASLAAAQDRVLMTFDNGGGLSLGNEHVGVDNSDFPTFFKDRGITKVHIVVDPAAPLDRLQRLVLTIPVKDVTWSVGMEPGRMLSAVATTYEERHADPVPTVDLQTAGQKPVFPYGDPSIWVAEHLVYPSSAWENGIQGRVILQFTISRFGHVEDIKVLRSPDKALEQAAISAISAMPDWIPGAHGGSPVAVTYVMPVVFQLNTM